MSNYDIGASNQRQSDWLWGWNDAEAGKLMRLDVSEDYLRGFMACRRKTHHKNKVQS